MAGGNSMTLVAPDAPILWQKADAVQLVLLPWVIEQAGEMRVLMEKAGGAALAAPQVGIGMRFFVTKVGRLPFSVIINPEVVKQSGVMVTGEEKCLTWPGEKAVKVRRPKWVFVTYMNELGTQHEEWWTDFQARVFCHELDHLNGICVYPKPGLSVIQKVEP